MNIGGQASIFLSTFDVDLKYVPSTVPLLLFGRVQFLPRYGGSGNDTRVIVEQAFAKIAPFSSLELAFSIGKFDSVFGIEYLENEANLRTNITPSLIARYTTGQSLGLKAFYRIQIPGIWSAVSLNAAVTNGGTFPDWVELYNTSSNSVSLNNWSLSNSGNARKYIFPNGTSIPAGAPTRACQRRLPQPALTPNREPARGRRHRR